jgi:replicative DNA helicase
MIRTEAKEIAKTRLAEYLQRKGVNTKKLFRCLHPNHEDKTPSMSYDSSREIVKCFSKCNTSYDIFDLVGLDYGLTSDKDKFDKTYEILNLTIDDKPLNFSLTAKTNNTQHSAIQNIQQDVLADNSKGYVVNYAQFYQEASANINQTSCADYLEKRGISIETAKRYDLGFAPEWISPTALLRAKENNKNTPPVTPRVIIPTSQESYTALDVRDNLSEMQQQYKKLKEGKVHIFNIQLLTQEAPCFVVEGEMDALSFLEIGHNAIALGSTSNVQIFLDVLKTYEVKAPLILALDTDKAGKEASIKLEETLKELKIDYFVPEDKIYNDYKDANEFLQNDREFFIKKAKSVLHSLQDNIDINLQASIDAEEVARQEYNKITAYSAIRAFQDYIQYTSTRASISTGFKQLDTVLGGSLFEGLYAIGAISSLGKTTFILQIADFLAKQGQDVLYFSLEMSKYELMAKSISRETLLHCTDNDIDIRKAKTIRDILDGRRYFNYGEDDRKVIHTATNNYKEYSHNLYFHERIGDIGIKEIKLAVEAHRKFTGKTPIIIIDYLQIISSDNTRATDKQNTDKAVLELKRISRDFITPVIVISSLNRASYKDQISFEAFKESGAIEYSTDVVIGLQLKGAGNGNFNVDTAKNNNPRELELKILKNRSEKTGVTIGYKYYPMFNLFKETGT